MTKAISIGETKSSSLFPFAYVFFNGVLTVCFSSIQSSAG